MNIIKGTKDINAAINSIKTRGANLDSSIQLAALSVLAHASEHGDITLADKLVMAMPKGGRKLALVEFMLAFGQVAKKANAKTGAVFTLDKTRVLDLASADAKPWTEFKKEASISTAFDAQAAVLSLINRLRGTTLAITNREAALKEAQALVALLSAAESPTVI